VPDVKVPDARGNVWLRSSDPAVASHRLLNFEVPTASGMQPPIVYDGRRWVFRGTRFEKNDAGDETRWLMFLDDGPVE